MSPIGSRDVQGAMAQINVTPMADIMIVLLVIFMVVTPILDQDARLNLPAAAHAEERKGADRILVVSIRSDRTLLLNGDRLDNLGELLLRLTERLAALPPDRHVVHVRADEALPYSEVLQVLQAFREAGVDEVALLSRKKVEG